MYGVNTGIGEFSEMVLDDEQVKQFQRYLIYNHAAGIGEPCPLDHIRAAMLLRVNVHANGLSGCRPEITEPLIAMRDAGGTRGLREGLGRRLRRPRADEPDRLLMMGEGEAFFEGARGCPAPRPRCRGRHPGAGARGRDGLAVINGSNLTNAIGCLTVWDVERWLKQAEIACAMSLEALRANMKPYDSRLHELRGFRGAVTSAANIRAVIDGSDLLTGKEKVKVQDAYSMRSSRR